MTLYKTEIKENIKSLLIWSISVGVLCMICILLYTSMQDSVQDMEASFADMGAFSQAFGMNKLSIATLTGYYATSVAMIHSIGGAMFAALTASVILSKEEAGHTSEFLNTFPIGRKKITAVKYVSFLTIIAVFNMICVAMYLLAFLAVDSDVAMKEFALFHLTQFLMHLEIGTICFMISAFSRKNLMGAGLGLALGLYALDLICRIVPAAENLKYVTPFYYSNASDIFAGEEMEPVMLVTGVAVTAAALVIAVIHYDRKDLAA